MKIKFLCLCLLAVALVGCRDKSPAAPAPSPAAAGNPKTAAITGTPVEQVQKTVQRYNQLLADGYRNLNMTPLQEVASADQAEKAYVHMAAISEGKSRMVSQLKNVTFTRTEFPKPERCEISTDEIWDFAYHDIVSGATSGEQKNFLYHVSYTLDKKGGRWVITDIIANSDEPDRKPAQPRHITADAPPPGHGSAIPKH